MQHLQNGGAIGIFSFHQMIGNLLQFQQGLFVLPFGFFNSTTKQFNVAHSNERGGHPTGNCTLFGDHSCWTSGLHDDLLNELCSVFGGDLEEEEKKNTNETTRKTLFYRHGQLLAVDGFMTYSCQSGIVRTGYLGPFAGVCVVPGSIDRFTLTHTQRQCSSGRNT
jgi:hypothetical protein